MNGCACFEYVGDNQYCPVHGKEAQTGKVTEASEEPKAQVLVVHTSKAGGKMIATLVEVTV